MFIKKMRCLKQSRDVYKNGAMLSVLREYGNDSGFQGPLWKTKPKIKNYMFNVSKVVPEKGQIKE